DRAAMTLDIRKGPSIADEHPLSAFTHGRVSPEVLTASLFRLGTRVASGGLEGTATDGAAMDLLLRRPPRIDQNGDVQSIGPLAGESVTASAVRIVTQLHHTALAIQGPPGSGKT